MEIEVMPGKKKLPAVGHACQQHTAEQQQWCAPFADGRVPEPQEQGIGSNKGEQPAQQRGSLPDGLRPQRDILNGKRLSICGGHKKLYILCPAQCRDPESPCH